MKGHPLKHNGFGDGAPELIEIFRSASRMWPSKNNAGSHDTIARQCTFVCMRDEMRYLKTCSWLKKKRIGGFHIPLCVFLITKSSQLYVLMV